MFKKPDTVIDLKTFGAKDYFPDFCVLEDDGRPAGEHLFTLSPRIMSWSPGVWIVNLQDCRNFWETRCAREGIGFYDLFEKALSTAFQGGNYRGVFAQHPWPALVFLQILKEKEVQGVYALQSLLNQKRYVQMGWLNWFAPLEILSQHLSCLKAKGFRVSTFRAKQAQMKRFIKRMRLAGPFDLKEADAAAISRRFSGWLGRVWQWTFQHSKTVSDVRPGFPKALDQSIALQSFPWESFKLRPRPRIVRQLDDPIHDWQYLEPLFQADLSRLCLSEAWGHNKAQVTEITWVLTQYDLKTIPLVLSFRYPYKLHADEKNGFKTACHQAYYAYNDAIKTLRHRGLDLDCPEALSYIGWSIEVSEWTHSTSRNLSLIPCSNEHPEIEPIIDIQNKLSVEILSFCLRPDFDPACAFQNKAIDDKPEYEYILTSWVAASQKRPLFFYPKPKPLTLPSESKPVFLERTAVSWWEIENPEAVTKDYYLVQNEQGHRIWAYQNSDGQWMQYGIYS